jgi:hypothetical protein
MAIRKTGAVTGQITEVEQEPQEGITATGSLSVPEWEQAVNWTGPDEDALAGENEEADQA